jgi:hypothetical protein
MPKKTILVEGTDINLVTVGDGNYISLTDIDQKFDGGGRHIENWMRNQNTIEYLATWEMLHNATFNSMQLQGVKEQIGLNRFLLSVKKWVEMTNAIGLKASAGRYGGTYAHMDIAFHFCLWLSPTFQLYVAKEFQKLKIQESQEKNESLEWSLKRTLSKMNYRVHSDAVKMHLIPPRLANTKQEGIVYANEADVLNISLFGITAKQWKEANPTLKGNIRDYATAEQLLVLVNLENLNAHFIKEGKHQSERLRKLNEVAIYQMELFEGTTSLRLLNKNIENADGK